MSEDRVVPAGAAAAKASKPNANLQLARGIARSIWQPGFKAANPGADAAAVAAAWSEVRQEQTAPILKALKVMTKRGYSFAPPAVDTGADEA